MHFGCITELIKLKTNLEQELIANSLKEIDGHDIMYNFRLLIDDESLSKNSLKLRSLNFTINIEWIRSIHCMLKTIENLVNDKSK